ncbi:hypothetical protein D3C71_1135990 [compost metagenome]
MRAVQQGKFDGLCGVYAIINALDPIGLTGPRTNLHRNLFRNIIKALPPKSLAHAVIHGLETEQLINATRQGLRWLRHSHDIDVRVSRWRHLPTDKCEFIRDLSTLSERPEHAVILCFAKPGLQHWSVVAKIDHRAILLRDSGGLTRLEIDRFDLERGRYRLIAEDTVVVRRLMRSASSSPL